VVRVRFVTVNDRPFEFYTELGTPEYNNIYIQDGPCVGVGRVT